MKHVFLAALLLCTLLVSGAQAQNSTADMSSLVTIVFGDTVSDQHGVYLGNGLVLTNWHSWTLDGQYYTDDDPAISPSRQIPRYDADRTDDPGEYMLDMADCGGTWTILSDASPTCTPFVRLVNPGFIFPLSGDDTLVPVKRLLYASRSRDIALFEVSEAAVNNLGVQPARLSMVATDVEHPVVIPVQNTGEPVSTYELTLRLGEPALLPQGDPRYPGGPWRVPSLVLDTAQPLPAGSPVFCQQTGDLLGLVWREGDDGLAWVTPVAGWFHDLYAANDEIQNESLAAVLAAATTAPVDAPPTIGDPLTPGLGNSGIDVLHYTLKLDIDPAAGSLTGLATLDIRATYHKLLTFSLDAYQLGIQQVMVNGATVPFVAKEQKLIIQLPEPVDYGTEFQVAIAYQATPKPYISPYIPYFEIGMFNQEGVLYALNEPDAAHSWFPCNDHPRDPATYDFYLRVASPLEAAANGVLVETIPQDDGSQTYHWQMDDPMATYLALVVVGDYVVVETQMPGGPLLRHYVYPEAAVSAPALFSATDDAIMFFETVFGPYPFNVYGHIVTPQDGVALENQTLTTLSDDVLGGDEESIFDLMAHELAHQWVGDDVTLGGWAHIWLNEGLATYADWLAQEARYGPEAAFAARAYAEENLFTGSRESPLIAPDSDEMFDTSSYQKGAWLLHMLRRQIGDEAFFTFLKTYAQEFSDRPVESLDFWQLAEQVSGQDLNAFFEQWLLQGDMPRYTLYWTVKEGDVDMLLCPQTSGSYRLTLQLTFSDGTNEAYYLLETTNEPVWASFGPDFTPNSVSPDPDQELLAQIVVQPIADLPQSCPPPATQPG